MDKDINKRISIIIATFNGYKYIAQAIDSALSQTYKNIELIIVDDGSTDTRLKEVLFKYIKNNLIIYVKKENGGQGSARNEGIKLSKGKYVAFLDDDDYWAEDKLEKQFALLEGSNFILCYTDSFLVNEEGFISFKTSKEVCGGFYNGFILDNIILKNFITLSSVLIKKEFLLKNLFNEGFYFRRIEDYDLWLRLSSIGKFCYVNNPLTYYRTKQPLSSKIKFFEYKKISKMFYSNIINSKINHKHYYVFGWLLNLLKMIFFKLK